jgi:LPXTG-site transpeptidase (sortase) family protein
MRPAAVVGVLGLAVAIGLPVAWQLSQPTAAAGAPVAAVLRPPAAPTTEPDRAPLPVGVRDAAPVPAAPIAAPVHVTVPTLDIDAPVDPAGVAADGQMQIPGDVDRVGWYRFGTAPGRPGNAVLAGHVDDAEQGLGAFAPLRGAEVGAEVVLTDSTGVVTRWRVVSRQLIDKEAVPLDALFARSGPPRLVLVTCGGPFDAAQRSYEDNVVVVAEPIS